MKGKTRGFAVFLSVLLTMSMIFGGLQLKADPPITPTYNGLDNYLLELIADPETNTKPTQFGTTAADGRVWVDKTVKVDENNFEVTLSALAQEYVRQEIIVLREQAAADVVFIIDMSASMTAERILRMKDALNKGIDIIMGANPRNRIGVYYYGLTGTSQMGTLFELASYSVAATGDGTDATNRYMTSSGQTLSRVAGITRKLLDGATNTTTATTVNTSAGTATQRGLANGVQALINDITPRTPSSEDSERVPYVMLLTDGEANRANVNWYNSPPNGTERTGSGPNGTAEISALTILSAAKLRDQLETAYKNHSGDKKAVWFTVAFGLTEGNNLATALLKPEKLATSTDSNLVATYNQLVTLTNNAPAQYKKYGVDGTPGYVYADEYIYFVGPSDLETVNKALEDLARLVEAATQERILPFQISTDYGDVAKLVISDTIGQGMELKDTPKMGDTVGTIQSVIGTKTTYSFASLNSTVVYDSATNELVWSLDENEIPLIMFTDRKTPVAGNYSNPTLEPLALVFHVGLVDDTAGTYYSNKTTGTLPTVKFMPMRDNPYYYKNIIVDSEGKVISSEIKPLAEIYDNATLLKTQNATSTNDNVYENQWTVEKDKNNNDVNVFKSTLGNNGKVFVLLEMTKTPSRTSVLQNEVYTERFLSRGEMIF